MGICFTCSKKAQSFSYQGDARMWNSKYGSSGNRKLCSTIKAFALLDKGARPQPFQLMQGPQRNLQSFSSYGPNLTPILFNCSLFSFFMWSSSNLWSLSYSVKEEEYLSFTWGPLLIPCLLRLYVPAQGTWQHAWQLNSQHRSCYTHKHNVRGKIKPIDFFGKCRVWVLYCISVYCNFWGGGRVSNIYFICSIQPSIWFIDKILFFAQQGDV